MSEYVKIKRSKNIRFRLISLMYLIFIVLSMTQIPVAWLKITNPISQYFTKSVSIPNHASQQEIQAKILALENEFKAFIQYQSLNPESPELNSYSKTDAFFLKNGGGEKLFIVLNSLKNTLSSQIEKEAFNHLFEADIQNGLTAEKADTWVNYKFKHTPANLVIAQLEELQVRIGLLSNQAALLNNELAEPKLSLLARYTSMRVGDASIFQVKGDSLQDVSISRNGTANKDYTLQANGFVFKPSLAGSYTLIVRGKVKTESLSIAVLPASFPARNSLPFRICYKGVNYTQTLPFQQGSLELVCPSDPYAAIKKGVIHFTPETEGWCSLLVKNKQGVLFHDSVFVKPLPEPLILVSQIPNLSCSRQRLKQMASLKLMAFHPSFKEGEAYGISSFKVRSIGNETKIENIQGNSYAPAAADIAHLQYLVFYDIQYKIGSESKVKAEPILIEIN